MITRFHVENFKALRDVTLDLTPIHVLIGPNDSGKTSILMALAALSRSVDHPLSEAFLGLWQGQQLVWGQNPSGQIHVNAILEDEKDGKIEYEWSCVFAPRGRKASYENESVLPASEDRPRRLEPYEGTSSIFQFASDGSASNPNNAPLFHGLYGLLKGVLLCKWETALMALPTVLDSKRWLRMEPSGFGLAQFLGDILEYDRDRFTRLEDAFKKLFPAVTSIRLQTERGFALQADDPTLAAKFQEGEGKGCYVQFAGMPEALPAGQLSDGMVIMLAYLAVLFSPDPPRFLLVEEPENGIHPARLKEIVGLLRETQREQNRTQIILTTHSPYMVNLFSPEEVTLCTKEQDGSVSVRRLSEIPKVNERKDIFTLGEIWTGVGDEDLSADKKSVQEVKE